MTGITWIVDFCGDCGVLLPEGAYSDHEGQCENCGNDLISRENRIQGIFTETEAKRLYTAIYNIEAATDAGCLCPVIDNHYGNGVPPKGDFYVNVDCPLHGQESNKIRNAFGNRKER